jgi:ribose transport system substrate-binding protein
MTRFAYALLFAFAAFSVTSVRAQTSAPTVQANATMLAFVTNNPSDYWTICRKGTEAAAKDFGVTVQFVEPSDGTVATQKQDVDDLLAKGVSGIAISPVDPANETSYLNITAAKVNLITSDSDAPASNRLCYVGADNRAAGYQAGQMLREALPHGGQIMLFVGSRRAQNAHDRELGIRDALRGSHIQIMGVSEDNADHAHAQQNAKDALVQYPHLAAMVGIWSYNGPAILSAVRNAHKIGKVKIVCFDEEAETLAAVKDGEIYATIVQQPYQFGYQSVKLLARLAAGSKSAVPSSRRMIVPTLAIKRSNVSAYLQHQAALLQSPE